MPPKGKFFGMNEEQTTIEKELLFVSNNNNNNNNNNDIIIMIIIMITIIIVIMALPRWHFHRVAFYPPGGPTALRPCPRTVWRKKIT